MSDYDEAEAMRRAAREFASLTEAQKRTMRASQRSLESWIYRVAHAIARAIRAPFEWIADLIRGFIDGLLGR